MHAIESIENFNQEVAGLIGKIKQQIDSYSSSVNTGGDLNTKDAIGKINVLKKYDLLMKPVPNLLAEMNHEDWEVKKEGLQKTFQEAKDALKNIIKT